MALRGFEKALSPITEFSEFFEKQKIFKGKKFKYSIYQN